MTEQTKDFEIVEDDVEICHKCKQMRGIFEFEGVVFCGECFTEEKRMIEGTRTMFD